MPELVARLRAAGCVFAEDEAELLRSATTEPDALEQLVLRRVAGEPLEYVVGWVDFDGHRVVIEPGVFIPRQRTIALVDVAADHLASLTPDGTATVVDVCCGSGALGLALGRRHPDITLHATDLDPVAARCATGNLGALGGHVHTGDLLDPLPAALAGLVDVLLANVPYVPTASVAQMPPDSRDHEPRAAVDGGSDGLDLLRRVAAVAPAWLRAGGIVLHEVATDQVTAASTALSAAGLTVRVERDDERDATVLVGVRD